MGYKLCTTEKPSVAADIARVLNVNIKKNGYYIGNGYIVTWALGHLVTLAEPEAYGDRYKDRNDISLLPLIPAEWKFQLIESVKHQFYIIKELMDRDDVDLIIDCGDMGETGHYLQWLIRMYAGCNKPVKRFCATSLTDEAIKSAMANLRDIDEFKGIIKGALCKAKGDWSVGMTFSRLFSAKYHSNLTVGRVQTPTLFFVVKRYLDNINFKPSKYYELEVHFGDLKTKLINENNSIYKILNKADAENLLLELKNSTATVIKLDIKRKSKDRPQLYDITELERDGNKLFGYTASEVLEIAQCLYEKHKILSYPRTDSRYLTSDLAPYMIERIKDISTLNRYNSIANNLISKGLNLDNKIVNDSKVTDHHALIVTENIRNFPLSTLNDKEINILHLVISRMLVSFSNKYIYDETIIDFKSNNKNLVFRSIDKATVSLGWRKLNNLLLNESLEDGPRENSIVKFKLHDTVNIDDILVLEKITEAPKLHTEGTLLTAMENAGATISDNKGYREILKGHGIGTQATRAEIIKKLFDVGYVETLSKKKVKYIIPTKKGINAVKIFPNELLSPVLTAEWETKIAKVADGTITEKQFMDEFKIFMINTLEACNKNDVVVDFSIEKESLGPCPWCNDGTIHESNKGYYCSNSKKCTFFLAKDNAIFKSRTKKNISKAQIKKLLGGNKIIVSCVNKNNVKYDGSFMLTKNSLGYATVEFSFVKSKVKK